MMKQIKIGVSGDIGSFSEEAGFLYAEKAHIQCSELIYLIDMENVLAAVEVENVDIGVFPVVNLRGGLVKMAFEAMGRHAFLPIDELWLNVEQCLLTKPGVKMDGITQIVSHPQALAQCKDYLEQSFKDIIQIDWEDTAKAAKDLGEGQLSPNTAVIAPKRCGKLYGLEILQKGIQDQKPNLTAFVIAKSRRGL